MQLIHPCSGTGSAQISTENLGLLHLCQSCQLKHPLQHAFPKYTQLICTTRWPCAVAADSRLLSKLVHTLMSRLGRDSLISSHGRRQAPGKSRLWSNVALPRVRFNMSLRGILLRGVLCVGWMRSTCPRFILLMICGRHQLESCTYTTASPVDQAATGVHFTSH